MSANHRKLNSNHWRRLRRWVLDRDNHTCQRCGKVGVPLECDHVVPLHDGGTNNPDNLQALCSDCHMDKTWNENNDLPREMREWYKRLRMKKSALRKQQWESELGL